MGFVKESWHNWVCMYIIPYTKEPGCFFMTYLAEFLPKKMVMVLAGWCWILLGCNKLPNVPGGEFSRFFGIILPKLTWVRPAPKRKTHLPTINLATEIPREATGPWYLVNSNPQIKDRNELLAKNRTNDEKIGRIQQIQTDTSNTTRTTFE